LTVLPQQKMDALLARHALVESELASGLSPDAYVKLSREFAELSPVVEAIKAYRGTDKEMKSSETAFSVTHGVRKKLKPVLDDKGKQVMVNGKPAYHEMDTKESKGDTNLANIFKNYFGKDATPDDIKKLGSFTGLLSLINKTFKDADKQKITDGFARTLWGPQAQGLYKGDPEKDSEEKNAMMKLLNKTLGTKDTFDADRKTFYAAYK